MNIFIRALSRKPIREPEKKKLLPLIAANPTTESL